MSKVTNIFIGLKKTCLGVLERGERDKNYETGLKEGGVIEMSTTVLSIYAMLALLSLCNTYAFVDIETDPKITRAIAKTTFL